MNAVLDDIDSDPNARTERYTCSCSYYQCRFHLPHSQHRLLALARAHVAQHEQSTETQYTRPPLSVQAARDTLSRYRHVFCFDVCQFSHLFDRIEHDFYRLRSETPAIPRTTRPAPVYLPTYVSKDGITCIVLILAISFAFRSIAHLPGTFVFLEAFFFSI